MKTIQIILLFLIVIGLGLIFTQKHWVPQVVDFILSREEKTAVENNTDAEAAEKINFDEIGHFTKDNPGLKAGVWYLIYEKPGAPALSAELSFDEKSRCLSRGEEGKCPDIFLPLSSLTRVRGVLENGVVRVIYAGDSFNK